MVTLLPDPDSPTIPSTSPFSSVMSTPSTARTIPPCDGNATDRFSISRSGIRSPFNSDHALSLELGIERVTQSVAEKVEGQHGYEDRQARKRDDPPSPQHKFARIRQHGPPFGQGRLRTETEKAERGRVQD